MTAEFAFEDREDARRYLGEIGSLWAVWIVALFAITFSTAGLRLISAIGGIVAIVIFSRPLRRRAAEIVPDEEALVDVGFRGGPRERMFRSLAYGAEPLRAAVSRAQASSVWFALRIGMLALTMLGFAAVVVDYLG